MADGVDMDCFGSKITRHNTDRICTEWSCSSEETRFHELTVHGMKMYVVLCDRHSQQLYHRNRCVELGKPQYVFDDEKGAYMIPCKVVNGQYVFWCDWCGTHHRHGCMDGYRVPHCYDDAGPYSGKNIYVYEGTEDDPPYDPNEC